MLEGHGLYILRVKSRNVHLELLYSKISDVNKFGLGLASTIPTLDLARDRTGYDTHVLISTSMKAKDARNVIRGVYISTRNIAYEKAAHRRDQ